MNQFLDRHKLLKSTQAKFQTQSEFSYINLKNSVHNWLPPPQSLDPSGSTDKIYQTFKVEVKLTLHKILWKMANERLLSLCG